MEWEHSIPTAPEWAANEIARLKTELALARLERDNIASLNSSLIAELAAAQTIATRERAEADVQIERRIEVEAELAAAKARTGKCGMEGHNKPCYYCGEPCNSLVGNPSRWPVALCHADEPGVVKWHHTGCVMERLAELAAKDARIASLEEELASTRFNFTGLRNATTARIAELAEANDHLHNICAEKHARAERAEVELKAMQEALTNIKTNYGPDTVAGTIARAALAPSPAETFRVPALTPDQEVHLKTLEPQPYDPDTMIGAPSPAGPDGKSLAVIYCMERAEEDVKLLREALEDMIAVAEGRFDGNPHADIDALAKARAARDHSLAGEKT